MTAKYIIRLDDACPTMKIENWEHFELIFDSHAIKPIVAVIPNNDDEKLKLNPHDSEFWKRIRKWRDKSWVIGMHGYEHKPNSLNGGILGFNKKSEFAELPIDLQREKIRKGWQIFLENDIIPSVWIAPFHAFDLRTLEAVKAETSIRIISDGIAIKPFIEKDFIWIPQQLWGFKYLPVGTWTVCLHPNTMTYKDIIKFEDDLLKYKDKIIQLDVNNLHYKEYTIIDRLFRKFFLSRKNF